MTGDLIQTKECPECRGSGSTVDFNYVESDCQTCAPFGGLGFIECDIDELVEEEKAA